ncbi:MAG: metallophosphoesterase [Brockia lithotrophica]|nr:metallophosphoesterase [Brockia lithotrophica]
MKKEPTLSRRRFLLGASVGILTLSLPISLAASARTEVKKVEVALPDLPEELDGLTVAHISDLHYGFGKFRNPESVDEIKALVMAQSPELIAFTGDLLDRTADPDWASIPLLKGLKAPLGVYAVLGNHDRHFDIRTLEKSFADAGVELLLNQSVGLQRNGRTFWVVGLDDPFTGLPDLDRATASLPPGDFRLLLVHAPDFAPRAAHFGIPLQLSGHSHGGQIRLPGIGPLVLPPLGKEYPMGLRQVPGSGTHVYTTCGLGTSIVPLRLFCRPEVTLLVLRSRA